MTLPVVIVVKDSWRDALECLESLLRIEDPGVSVVVCDNTETGSDVERIRAWAEGRLEAGTDPDHPLRALSDPPIQKPVPYVVYERAEAERGGDPSASPRLVLVRNLENLGFAGGNNVGLRYLLERGDAPYVWLLNPDTVVHPDAPRELLRRMEGVPHAGICGSTVLEHDEPGRVQALGGGRYLWMLGLPRHIGAGGSLEDPIDAHAVERSMTYVYGASMLVSMRFVRDIGLMDESYFLYFEELDWALRAAGRYRLCYAPASLVYHRHGSNLGSGASKSVLSDRYFMRNRLLIARRFRPRTLPGVYLGLLAAVVRRIGRGQWRRARMIAGLMVRT